MDSRRNLRANKDKELRCAACGVLLAKEEAGALSIRRGDLQATIDGEFRASLVCYRPRCRKLNVFRLSAAPPRSEPRAK